MCELGWSLGEWELACVTKEWDGIYLGRVWLGSGPGGGESRGEREHKVCTVSGSWVECELANEWGDDGVAEG